MNDGAALAESHRGAHVRLGDLWHEDDDVARRRLGAGSRVIAAKDLARNAQILIVVVARAVVKLLRVGRPAEHGARDLDHGDLQAEADAKERHAILARVAHGGNFALDAAHTKAARHEHGVRACRTCGPRAGSAERRRAAPGSRETRVDKVELEARLTRDRGVRERLDERLVRVVHADVLADKRDTHLVARVESDSAPRRRPTARARQSARARGTLRGRDARKSAAALAAVRATRGTA
jgi:hypothetical protein